MRHTFTLLVLFALLWSGAWFCASTSAITQLNRLAAENRISFRALHSSGFPFSLTIALNDVRFAHAACAGEKIALTWRAARPLTLRAVAQTPLTCRVGPTRFTFLDATGKIFWNRKTYTELRARSLNVDPLPLAVKNFEQIVLTLRRDAAQTNTLMLDYAGFQWNGALVKARGELATESPLNGRLEARITHYDTALVDLLAAQNIDGWQGGFLMLALNALAKPDPATHMLTLHVPLIVKDGVLFFGPLKLGRIE